MAAGMPQRNSRLAGSNDGRGFVPASCEDPDQLGWVADLPHYAEGGRKKEKNAGVTRTCSLAVPAWLGIGGRD